MMASTDFLRLSDHPLFKNVRETLPKIIKRTQNIMCVKEDVLYIWDFQDNCVLTLNIKAARGDESEGVIHQTLLPQTPPLFTPHTLIVNETNTLVAVIGSKGVLVVELPDRCPPYGAFANNKELIYCRSLSLHERVLAFSDKVEVRQVKFHPGNPNGNHILILTSDNLLRLYKIENGSYTSVATHPVGVQPMGRFPKTRTTFLEALGEVAIDFDFTPPELNNAKTAGTLTKKDAADEASEKMKDLTLINDSIATKAVSSTKIYPKRVTFDDEKKPVVKKTSENEIDWPILLLFGNGDVYIVNIELKAKEPAIIKGPLPMLPEVEETYKGEFCSILCLQSTPPIVCVANCKGTIHHAVLLPLVEDLDFTREENKPNFIEDPDKALFVFECLELELGLATATQDVEYSCPILLHKNLGKVGHYFASHDTGVHSVDIVCVENLHKFVDNQNDDTPEPDLFDQSSTAEYLICTKVDTSEDVNPVIGFSVYYDSPSILTLLANGQVVSLTLATLFATPLPDVLEPDDDFETMTSPLKKMLAEPFDLVIQRILKQSTTQPILKLNSSGSEHNQQECYQLLQRAAQVFREEHFKNHTKAREEIEKRVKTLTKLKDIQKKDVEKLMEEKQKLQQKAENLAEKYEDIKDKQEEISKRCQRLLVLIAKRRTEPSNAEKQFLKEVKDGESKVEIYKKAIAKVKNTIKYQELQMKNWHQQNEKENVLGNVQIDAIKSNLQDMTQKITNMIVEVNEQKKQLNLK